MLEEHVLAHLEDASEAQQETQGEDPAEREGFHPAKRARSCGWGGPAHECFQLPESEDEDAVETAPARRSTPAL